MAASRSAWLSDRAVNLQLFETGTNIGILDSAPDPALARRLFVALCFSRADLRVKQALESQLTAYRNKLNWTPVMSWLTVLKFQIEDDPSAFPFALNEKEFAYYAQQNFGGQIGDIKDIYKPPSFYGSLWQDIGVGLVGGIVGSILPGIIPVWASAGEFGIAATAVARSTVGSSAAAVLGHLLPGGSWDAAKKDRLWERYLSDYMRRKSL